MSGKQCFGEQVNNAGNLKNSRAFCEGREYRGRDVRVNVPITDNPHQAGSEAAKAWDLGWGDVDVQAGGYVTELGCCAAIGNVLV